MATKDKAKGTAKPKPGDKITSGGKTYTATQGGHWRGEDGKLFDNGKSSPTADAGAGAAGTPPANPGAYQNALNAIGGANSDMLGSGLKDLANGDAAIEKGLAGGAQIGASLFAPGSLGRVSQTASGEQTDILQNLKDKANWNQADTALQPSINRAESAANSAQSFTPEQNRILALRESALGGLNNEQLTATKEQAQAGFNQSLTSGVRALRVGQGGSGPSGAAANIAATPLTAQFANSQAGLQRQLIMDQFNAQNQARDAYSSDAQNITNSFQANRLATNTQASGLAKDAIADRASRYNNFVSYDTQLRQDLLGREMQNLNSIAAEKSGQSAAIFGGGSFASQQQGQQQSFELGKQNLDLQKDIFNTQKNAGSGGGGGGGGSSSSPGDGNSDVFG